MAAHVQRVASVFYVPLGPGLPLAGLGPLIGALLAGLSMGLFLLRSFIGRGFRRFTRGPRWWQVVLLLLVLGGSVMLWKWLKGDNGVSAPKVLVIGIDGMDPQLLDTYLAKGVLPHFARLREQGFYTRLGTTTPPESPVAWSTFATGCNPGKHGLFDFVHRAPKSYAPDLALVQVNGSRYEARRQGEPFWVTTSAHDVPTTVIRVPITFPPERVQGHLLSGMGVPDLRGSQGTFSYWTTEHLARLENMGGRVIPLTLEGDRLETVLYGPPLPQSGDPKDLTVPLSITLQPAQHRATITVQGQSHTLQEKEWSPWYRVTFKRGFFQNLSAICRFYLKSVTPAFALYGSPLNFDPEHSPYAISYPKGYARELAHAIGLYHTLGMPEDTWALNEERIDEETFLQQSQQIHAEREAMLWYELGRWREGILVTVFDTVDRVQHMFWRFIDPQHPLYDATQAAQYGNVIEDWYRQMDTMLGRVLQTIDQDTILVVLSDHGFSSFRRAVHLNTWLKAQGLLRLKGGKREGREFAQDVDWEHTQAYALGIGGIYLNRVGREPRGVVTPEQAASVLQTISDKLLTLTDPQSGEAVVRSVLPRETVYTGPQTEEAPDLFVGFAAGYRASWQTALGGTPEALIEDNTKKWSGDHIVDPELVPGILLMNRQLDIVQPRLEDIAPTILRMVGVTVPPTLDGTSLWQEGASWTTTTTAHYRH